MNGNGLLRRSKFVCDSAFNAMQSQAGDGSTFPKPGQKVTCHYVLTLQVQHGEVDEDKDGGVCGHHGDNDGDGDDGQKVTCSHSSGAAWGG